MRYPELRRTRASRAIIPLRLIQLPIDITTLQKSYDEIIEYFNKLIIENLAQHKFRSLFPKLSVVKSLDISWYYHILLIADKERFIKELDHSEAQKIEALLESIEAATPVTKLNAISQN